MIKKEKTVKDDDKKPDMETGKVKMAKKSTVKKTGKGKDGAICTNSMEFFRRLRAHTEKSK